LDDVGEGNECVMLEFSDMEHEELAFSGLRVSAVRTSLLSRTPRLPSDRGPSKNEDEEIVTPLLVVVHGTDMEIAWSIACNGFAALATLDAGYYGKGLYFTSYAKYTIPYCCSKPNPAILVCLLLPGNPFPVCEHPKEERSLQGHPLHSGYQSHYIRTKKTGFPIEDCNNTNEWDEIVVGQEAQVVPLFLVSIANDPVKLSSKWEDIPETEFKNRRRGDKKVTETTTTTSEKGLSKKMSKAKFKSMEKSTGKQ